MSNKSATFFPLFGAVLIVSIILFSCSFRVIKPEEMALKMNKIKKTINDEKLFVQGRHFIGLHNKFIKYPKVLQTIQFNGLQSRSHDGLQIVLDCSFQYKIVPQVEEVISLYLRFKTDYVYPFENMAKKVVRNVASTYIAFDYFFNRSSINMAIGLALNEYLLPLGAEIDQFQLLNIAVPQEFADAIEQTEVAREKIKKVEYEQESAIVESNTRISEAQKNSKIKLEQMTAQANSITFNSISEASALAITVGQETEAYDKIAIEFGLTSQQLIDWIWLDSIQDSNAKQYISVEKPAALNI